MSTRKQLSPNAAEPVTAELSDDQIAELPSGSLGSLEVTSLELDERFEVDTDPYNRTGSHYVAALRRKDD